MFPSESKTLHCFDLIPIGINTPWKAERFLPTGLLPWVGEKVV